MAEMKVLQSENESLKSKAAKDALGDVMNQVKEVKGVKLLAVSVAGVDMNGLRDLGDQLKAKIGEGVIVLISDCDGKVNMVAMATQGAMDKGAHAGNLIKGIAAFVGGGGGTVPSNVMRYRLDDGTPAQPPAPINADTLQGHNAEYFATAAGLEALAAQAVMPYKAGDSYSFSSFDTGGFITGNARNGYFHIPLWKPVIASAVSVTGSCRIRQGGKYLFGTSDDKADISSLKVESLIKEGYIYFKLTKEDGFTDAINNDACAIDLDATITFGEAT